ncbi:hypothetical protein N7471_010579 [Penicillium samsonianum]|uniref:uncharacterized protein n=1 Tax=Penicillium samsonianum TaxID=1882272 RepID=UPI00254761FC|nr:uncharacterized protein N7471_010579 [Penicillium samsonianum]KAJ6126086.1 hypothetical protein N7471_010579 [Penicillium samsonianum]
MAQTAIWDADGVLRSENTPYIDCIVGDLVSGKAFDFVLLFKSIGLIHEQSGDFGRKTFIISEEMRLAFGRDTLFMEEWARLVLVCHAFPGHWEEQWFLEHGRILLPQLRHAFDFCPSMKSRVIDDPIHGYKVLLTLILSTRVPGADWRLKAINIAEDILSAKPEFGNSNLIYLESLLNLRKLETSRRLQSAHFENSDDLHSPIDARSNCIHGALIRSKAQDYIMENPSNLEEADRLLRTFGSWDPMSPSTMELYEINLQKLILCKIRRWKAEFGQAVEQLDALTHFFGHNYDDTGCNFWSHYAGTLCELHRFTEAEEWSRHTIAAHQDLQSDRIFATGQKRYRMLRLSLAETLLSKSFVEHGFALCETENDLVPAELEESLMIYEELNKEYQTLARRDWASRLEHLRVVLGKAMIVHMRGLLEDAKQHWNNVLTIVQYCQENNQVTGFLEMVVQYCRCDIAARQEDYNEAHLFLKAAKAQFADIGREHWWTCIGTDFLDHLRNSLAKRDMISGIDER